MSKRKIEAALKRKGIKAVRIEYLRSCPTPFGYAKGWDVDLSENTEDKIWMADHKAKASQFMEFGSLSEVLDWIESLPYLNSK